MPATGRTVVAGIALLSSFLGLAADRHADACWQAGQAALPSTARPSLTGLIPEQAELFIEVSELRALNAALRRTRATTVLSLFAGRGLAVPAGGDLGRSVGALLGVTDPGLLDRIMSCSAAYAAPSWRELDGAVVILRVPDGDLLAKWFPPSRRTRVTREDRTLVFDSGGFRVATRDDLVAAVRQSAPQALFESVVGHLRNRRATGWSSNPAFRRLVATLNEPSLVRVGVRRPSAQPVGAVEPMHVEFGFEVAVVAAHESEGRLEIDLRARMPEPVALAPSSRATFDLMRRLPDTTLAAWAMTSDWREQVEAWFDVLESDPQHVVLAQIEEAVPLRAVLSQVFQQTRPPLVFAWGRPEPEHPSLPQLALFLECDDAGRVASGLAETFRDSGGNAPLRNAEGRDEDDVSAPLPRGIQAEVVTSDHFGVSLTDLRWRSYTSDGQPDPDADTIQLSPSFAPLDRWLVIALSPEHLRAIIESYHGIRPTLGNTPGIHALGTRASRSTTLAVAQPVLAAGVVSRWISEYQMGRSSPFDPSAWIGSRTRGRVARIGISVASQGFPGEARIIEVESGGPSASRLLAGDRVIAVDGQVLNLDEPVEDLRRKLLHSRRAVGPVIRVQREGRWVDVELPIRPSDAATGLDRAIPALRNLIQLGARIESASFATWTSPPDEFGSRLVMQFLPAAD